MISRLERILILCKTYPSPSCWAVCCASSSTRHQSQTAVTIMAPRRNHLVCAALIACIPYLASCSPQETPANNRNIQVRDSVPVPISAAPVPTHVLTKDSAGSLTLAEQGDFIEVRLEQLTSATGTWRLLRQTGSGRVEPLGQATLARDKSGTKRVFRFRAVRIGTLELAFVLQEPNKTPRPEEVVAFNFSIK